MQRPLRGFRGGIRIGAHVSHTHRIKEDDHDDDENRLSLSNSGELDDDNDSTIKSKHSSKSSSMAADTDLESAIRQLRPLVRRQKKNKNKPNISNQKADLPQMNMIEQKDAQPSQYWFPKPDIGHVDSTDFFRHNHIESHQINEPPTQLTAMPPPGISTRPTAIIAPPGPTRSISAFFTSSSSIKKATNYSTHDFQNLSLLNCNQLPISSSLNQTASSAFQPIQNSSSNTQVKMKSQSTPMDIPKHKPLERGQRLTKVHISHPQSPSIVHLMLHEDFNTACRLLHKMTAHPELQSDYIPPHPFKPAVNHICACFHEGRWFRCRVLQISSDLSTATVVYVDWGMMIPVQINPKCIRRLPNEFYIEPACSIICHLDGVSQEEDSIPSSIISQCIVLLSEDQYDVIVNDYHSTTGGQIILSTHGRIINEQIQQLLVPNDKLFSPEEELIEQFQHQIKLSIGDELKALLSSFSAKDDTFYVLLINEDTNAIDRAMSELQADHIPNREFLQIPQIKTLVVARYAAAGKYYRAWVKTVEIEHEQALVFFVDFGNESHVAFSDIYICPESVRTLPWLGIRIRLTNEIITVEELAKFWKLTESHYIWIRINEVLNDSYSVQIKIDYAVFLRHERLRMSTSKRTVHKNVQTKADDERLNYSRNGLDKATCILTPSTSNDHVVRNLIEMITNELRSLRHRINESDESSQDRHSQLMQLLFSIVNVNHNSPYPKATK